MQRQELCLLIDPKAPYVGTGMEYQAAYMIQEASYCSTRR